MVEDLFTEIKKRQVILHELSFSQRLGGVLAGKAEAAEEIAANRPWKQATGLYLTFLILFGCISLIFSYIQFKAIKNAISSLNLIDIDSSIKDLITESIRQETFESHLSGVYWQITIIIVAVLILWLGTISLAHFISKGLGGRGNIISSICFGAYLVPILLIFVSITLLFPIVELVQNYLILFIIPILYLIFFVWLAKSFITGMAGVHQISKGKATVAFILMILVWVIIGLIAWFASPLGAL